MTVWKLFIWFSRRTPCN